MTALKPRMTASGTKLPPITLIMLTADVLYVLGAIWMLGGAWQAVTHNPYAILLLASLGVCVGWAFALASHSRRDSALVERESELSRPN